MIQSIFSLSAVKSLERDQYGLLKFSSIVLNIFFVLNLAFLVYKINGLHKLILINQSQLFQFLFFLGLIFLFYVFKLFINEILGVITNKQKLVLEYTTSTSLINQTFGLFLFPCIILLQFSAINPFVFISISYLVIALSLVFKWYRGVVIGLVEERIGLLQIFTYFCGLEILPTLVVVKYIIETF